MTTRPIPTEKTISDESESRGNANDAHEQLKTIDPSLLNRTESNGKKKVLLETTSARRISGQGQEEGIRRPKTRHVDLLHRALEMNKKIWSLEKLQKILEMLGPDAFALSQRGAQDRSNSKQAEQKNLLQLLQNERVHGPSDRDPTVVTKEMHYFKGPYIYVFDIEEKTKPIMVREYAKVADKTKGEWPQFRVVSQGRCPFVEDYEAKEERPQTRPKERVVKAAVEAAAPTLRPPEIPPPKTVVGKRNFAEVEDGHNRGAAAPQEEAFEEAFDLTKIGNHSHGFMSRVRATRFVAGQEPEASGLQRSKATSAIRSQMISSTSGVLGVKAGTSKEFHGLQRKVLQKASTPTVSQDLSSRRLADMSHDSNTFVRSASLGHSHRKLDMVEEMEQAKPKERLRRTVTAPPKVKQKARDPKPGYCENCNDKFEDFDEVSEAVTWR